MLERSPAATAGSGVVRASPASARRPGTLRLLRGQTTYSTRRFLRTPVAAFFTWIFPLTVLAVLTSALSNPVVDPTTGLRLAQYLTPAMIVWGVAMASFCSLAIHIADDRSTGLLKRMNGTPVPAWVRLAGLVLSRFVVGLASLALVLAVGVGAFHVQVVGHRPGALALSFTVGVLCFSALGVAVAGLVRSVAAAQALTIALLIPLAFISDVFTSGTLPGILSAIGWIFPLRHFAHAMFDAFDPTRSGAGIDAGHLLVMAAWGVAGALVAVLLTRRESAAAAAGRTTAKPAGLAAAPAIEPSMSRVATGGRPARVMQAGRPSRATLMAGQARYALRGLLRDRLTIFLTTLMPIFLLVYFCLTQRDATWRGVPVAQYLTAALAAYGIAVATFVTLPQSLVAARQSGLIKRLSGTPLPMSGYLAGRLIGWLLAALAITVALFGVGIGFFGVRIAVARLPLALLVVVIGTLAFSALGFLLGALVREPRTVSALALGTLLPVAFLSEVFLLVEGMPGPLSAIGWVFPLRHFAVALFQITSPSGVQWGALCVHLAVLAAWGLTAAVLAAVVWRRGRLR
jgi:ABC-type multidrug transport system permease subunit